MAEVMRRSSLADLFATFFRVGLTSFGMAILQNLKTVAVRRGFVSEQELQEGLALVQLYPGPIVANLVAFVGYKKGGTLGAFVAMLGFVLPAFALMVLASMAYLKYGSLPGVHVMQQGLNALVVGGVAHVTLHFAEQHIATVPGALLAAAVFVVAVMRVNPLWPILAGLLVGAWLWGQQGETKQTKGARVFEVSRLMTPGLIAAALIALVLMASLVPSPLSTLLLEFMTIGAVAFGNGSTILPVMQEVVVNHRHWLTIGDFGVAIGLGHATPGPVMTVFVGLLANVVLSLVRHTMTEPLTFVFAGLALVGVRYLKQDLLTIFAVGLTLWGILAYRGMVTGQ